jgi:hypothetical protein
MFTVEVFDPASTRVIFNILLVFISWWEIPTYIHRTFLSQGSLHKA